VSRVWADEDLFNAQLNVALNDVSSEVAKDIKEVLNDVGILLNEYGDSALDVLTRELTNTKREDHRPHVNIIPANGKGVCAPVVIGLGGNRGPTMKSQQIMKELRGSLLECMGRVEIAIFIAPIESIGNAIKDSLEDIRIHLAKGALKAFIPIAVFDGKLSIVTWTKNVTNRK